MIHAKTHIKQTVYIRLHAMGIDRGGNEHRMTLYHSCDTDRRHQAAILINMRQMAKRILRKNRMKPTFNKSQSNDH